MENTVHVNLGDRSYDVVIGPGLLGQAGERIAGSNLFLLRLYRRLN